MDQAIELYLDFIREDYQRWINMNPAIDDVSQRVREQMIREFRESVRVYPGSKYVKVVANNSAHSFIVLSGGGKFRTGDILKSASWRAPATNFARGNILDNQFGSVTWTGA